MCALLLGLMRRPGARTFRLLGLNLRLCRLLTTWVRVRVRLTASCLHVLPTGLGTCYTSVLVPLGVGTGAGAGRGVGAGADRGTGAGTGAVRGVGAGAVARGALRVRLRLCPVRVLRLVPCPVLVLAPLLRLVPRRLRLVRPLSCLNLCLPVVRLLVLLGVALVSALSVVSARLLVPGRPPWSVLTWLDRPPYVVLSVPWPVLVSAWVWAPSAWVWVPSALALVP